MLHYWHKNLSVSSISMTKTNIIRIIKYCFPKTTPVLVGYFFVGATWAVLMYISGYGMPWTNIMSAIVLGGSIQYAALILVTSAFNPLYAFLLAILINIRHVFYGLSMLEKYNNMGKSKALLALLLTDETFSLLCHNDNNNKKFNESGITKKQYYLAVSILNYLYWQIGTLFGSIIAAFISSFNLNGIDFIFTAFIIVIFFENWLTHKNHYSAIVGITSTIIAILFFGKDMFIIPAMMFILILLLIPYIHKSKKELKQKGKE